MLQLTVMPPGLRGRVKDEKAVITVEQYFQATLQFFAGVVQSHHRRNVERARHDRGVRCPAAEVRCQSEDILAIHRRRIGGRDVVREKNVRVSQPEEILGRLALEISYD